MPRTLVPPVFEARPHEPRSPESRTPESRTPESRPPAPRTWAPRTWRPPIIPRLRQVRLLVAVCWGLTTVALAGAAPITRAQSDLFLSVAEVQVLMESGPVIFVDSRETTDYYLGHIPGAIHLPWRALTQRGCGFLCGKLDPDPLYLASVLTERGFRTHEGAPIVVYGAGKEGWGEEGRTLWTLEYLGLKGAVILDGGYPRWRLEGGAAARLWRSGTPTGSPIQIALQPDLIADRRQVQRWLTQGDVVFIDARTAEEYAGAPKYGVARGGHIPGAIHLYWRVFLQPDGRLKSRDELRTLMGEKGIRNDQRLVVYCTGGIRSAFVYAALRELGYTRIVNFPGSMWDYAADKGLPLELGAPGE